MPRDKHPLVVGVDPSYTSTGIAHVDGATEAIRTSSDTPNRIRRKQLVAAITSAAHRADLVVVEGYSRGSKQGREEAGALGESIRDALGDFGVPFIDIAPTKLKKWATGSGLAPKSKVKQAAVELLGLPESATHDEADALWLREAGLFLLGVGGHLPPADRAAALDGVHLPERFNR